MIRTIVFTTLLALSINAIARGSSHSSSHSSSRVPLSHSTSGRSPVAVHGYTKRNGTYVAPYRRSGPDRSKYNNWSSRGNVNADTGKIGTKDPTR